MPVELKFPEVGESSTAPWTAVKPCCFYVASRR
jgi:hypothetical protein